MLDNPRQLLRSMFDAAVAAALPARVVAAHLPPAPLGRTVVVRAGKASAAMAKAVEDAWPGPLEGLVVTRYGRAVPCGRNVEFLLSLAFELNGLADVFALAADTDGIDGAEEPGP